MAELTSVADIKTYGGITGSGDDTLLGVLLDAAEQAIRDYCNRPDGWTQDAFTELVDGAGVNTFTVTNVPVASSPAPVVKVYYTTTSSDTITATLYRFDPATGEFRYISGNAIGFEYGYDDDAYHRPAWPEGFQNIEVAYTGGYATIPAALTQAAKDATLWLYWNRKGNKEMQSESIGAYSYTRWTPQAGQTLPPQVTALLDPYRRKVGIGL